ncbi:MAG: discoidin domain-containing protein [Clostridia bacterium]|nr:discoidin domain-containing protein [Clostridia bacterium]
MKKHLIVLLVIVAALALLLSACTDTKTPAPAGTAALSEATEAPNTDDPAEPADATESADPGEEPTESADPGEEPTEGTDPVEEPTESADPVEEPTAEPAPTGNPDIASGTNVALTAEVDVSSTTGESHVQWGWSYEFVNDGLITDRDALSYGWTSEVLVKYDSPETDDWALFELKDYTTINSVKIWPIFSGTNFPVDYRIEVSTDDKTYTTVASVEGDTHAKTGSEEPVLLEFDPVTAKYVKFVVTKMHDVQSGNDGYIFQIAEIEIFAA